MDNTQLKMGSSEVHFCPWPSLICLPHVAYLDLSQCLASSKPVLFLFSQVGRLMISYLLIESQLMPVEWMDKVKGPSLSVPSILAIGICQRNDLQKHCEDFPHPWILKVTQVYLLTDMLAECACAIISVAQFQSDVLTAMELLGFSLHPCYFQCSPRHKHTPLSEYAILWELLFWYDDFWFPAV